MIESEAAVGSPADGLPTSLLGVASATNSGEGIRGGCLSS